jgi:hypothetical protein
MKNLKIEGSQITWEEIKDRFGSEFKYENEIIRNGDHIAIYQKMYIDGELKNDNITHVPFELIDSIKKLKPIL